MLVLGIESSCDDTSVALVDCSPQGHIVIAETTASQIDVHKKYGGVVPEIAGRMHAEKIVPLIEEVLSAAQASANHPSPLLGKEGITIRPDVIAVTAGPGLITGLIVGVEAARTLSYAWKIPLVATNHIEGHIHSVEISNSKFLISNFPALALVVSGGHTELILMRDHGDYQILGSTKDDAAGECFDKVAKLLGLPYPGGPEISKLAMTGIVDAIPFPRPMLDRDNFDFSFAGLKTSALYWLRDHSLAFPRDPEMPFIYPQFKISRGAVIRPPITINDFCASFEQAIVDVLVGKTLRAAKKIKPKTIVLAGGVAANKKLRSTLADVMANHFPDSKFLIPDSKYCMDNGAMIAVAGYYHALKKEFTDWQYIKVDPNWKIAEL